MQYWLSIGVIVFSAAAAVFWFLAAFTWVSSARNNRPWPDGWAPAQITENGANVVATARRQTFWNRFAALAACLAAICQAVLAYKYGKL
jgi:carbon starvation protein CstA